MVVGVVEELAFGLSESHLSAVLTEILESLLEDFSEEVGRIAMKSNVK